MINPNEIKNDLKHKYDVLAYESEEYLEEECGCGSGCGCHSLSSDVEYFDEPGYHPYADLGLGIGMPTRYAGIKEGQTVIDLGAGAGMDSFLAREITGITGKVIGIDMTERMVEKARKNAEIAGYNNVEFRLGEVEHLPVSEKTAHVVIGNGIMNMVPDKKQAFSEIYRILKHHGQLCLTEFMIKGDMPKGLKLDAELYVGCMAGSMSLEQYMQVLTESGFDEITIHEEKKLELPDAMLHYYLPPEEAKEFREGEPGIYSITLTAAKPCCHTGEEDHVCCGNH